MKWQTYLIELQFTIGTNRYNAGINPSQYLLDLQWNQGIHGLPREWTRPNYRFGQSWNDGVSHWYNPYYNQGMPMSSYVKLGFHKEWETTVNKYLKKINKGGFYARYRNGCRCRCCLYSQYCN